VILVHRGRFGGNARKAKTKLTDALFDRMIGVANPTETPIGVLPTDDAEADEAELETTEHLPSAVLGLMLHTPRAMHSRAFECKNYRFGYLACGNCRNEQAYYLHQEDLVGGVTFRCRVCRMELTVKVTA
jgi:ribosomal protein S27E